MKNITILLYIFLKFGVAGISQQVIVGDDLSINFGGNEGKERTMKSESDFCYHIIQTNLSTATKRVYKSLYWADTTSKLANYYWELYRKTGSGFVRIAPPVISDGSGQIESDLHAQYGNKGDSLFRVFDIEKVELLPSGADTLCFNLLYDNFAFEAGEYKFRVFLRIGNAYSVKYNRKEISDLFYVGSDWRYFRVPKSIKGLRGISKKEDCGCESRGLE